MSGFACMLMPTFTAGYFALIEQVSRKPRLALEMKCLNRNWPSLVDGSPGKNLELARSYRIGAFTALIGPYKRELKCASYGVASTATDTTHSQKWPRLIAGRLSQFLKYDRGRKRIIRVHVLVRANGPFTHKAAYNLGLLSHSSLSLFFLLQLSSLRPLILLLVWAVYLHTCRWLPSHHSPCVIS